MIKKADSCLFWFCEQGNSPRQPRQASIKKKGSSIFYA
jgi:hypothetical protein